MAGIIANEGLRDKRTMHRVGRPSAKGAKICPLGAALTRQVLEIHSSTGRLWLQCEDSHTRLDVCLLWL